MSQALCVMPGGSREGKTTTSCPSRGLRNRVESLPSSAAPRTELDLTARKGAHLPRSPHPQCAAISGSLPLLFHLFCKHLSSACCVPDRARVRDSAGSGGLCPLEGGQGERDGEEGVQGCRGGWGSGS